MSEIIKPPFTDLEARKRKVQLAEDLWNARDPERVALASTEDTQWRNRTEFLNGRSAVVVSCDGNGAASWIIGCERSFWCFRENRMAVSFFGVWCSDLVLTLLFLCL